MAGPSVLQQVGGNAGKQTRYAPIFIDRLFTGLFTNRNPLLSPGNRIDQHFYGGHPDALIDGQNIELSTKLTLHRRPGLLQYSTASIPSPNTFYEFHLVDGTIKTIVDTATAIYDLTTTSATNISTKAAGAGQAYFQNVGNILYWGDGMEQLAWQAPSGTVRNWGITNNGVAQTTFSDSSTTTSIPTSNNNPWVHTGGVEITVLNIPGPSNPISSDILQASGYTFNSPSIPATSTIYGIEVSLAGDVMSSINNNTVLLYLNLVQNGSGVGQTKIMTLSGTTATVLIFGGPSDLWGGTSANWPANSINSGSFGVNITAVAISSGVVEQKTVRIDVNVGIYVTFAGGPTVTTTTGSLSPTTGYQYVYEYVNTTSGAFSKASPPSNLIKPSSQGVSIPLVASTDPQVNQIWIFRTLDGGSIYYALPTNPYPNTTQSVTDNAADSTLNKFELADITGFNTPPPAGLINITYYEGRIWGSVGNVVYYSSGPDLGLVLGNGNEGFLPSNNIPFVPPIKRILPAFNALLVFTTSDTQVITGSVSPSQVLAGTASSANLFNPGEFAKNLGLLSWNALDKYGSSVILFTTDRRFLQIDPGTGVTDLGLPLGDIFQNIDASQVYVSYYTGGSQDTAIFFSDGSTGWFRCNPNQYPELSGPVWSPKAAITGGCRALANIETSPGVHKLLVGATGTGTVSNRDFNTFSDIGTPYTAFLTLGSITLAQPGQLAEVESISTILTNIGTQPSVGVLLDEISGVFETLPVFVNQPPELTPSLSLLSNMFYLTQGQEPAWCQHMQIKLSFIAEAFKNELLGLCIFGTIHQLK